MSEGKTHTKGRKHGKIHDLPEAVRKDIEALLLERKHTYEDIIAFIQKEHNIDLSRSGLSRYNQTFFEELREIEILRDHAAWINDDPESALNLEKLTATMITRRLATALSDGTFDVTTKQGSFLIDAFAKLQASSTKRAAFEQEMKTRVQKTAEAVATVAKKGGLSDDTVNDIKARILGIAK